MRSHSSAGPGHAGLRRKGIAGYETLGEKGRRFLAFYRGGRSNPGLSIGVRDPAPSRLRVLPLLAFPDPGRGLLYPYPAQWGPDSEAVSLWSKEVLIRPITAAAVLFLYALSIGWIGFFSSTFLLFLAWLIAVEREKWLTIGLVSILGTLSLYVIFIVFLKVPLPKGSLF